MGIPLGPADFTRGAAKPLDDQFVKADITARNAIPAGVRYDGMLCYVVADQILYQLKGGILDANWAVGGGGLVPSPTIRAYTGDGSTTVFALGVDPGTKDNIDLYLDGVKQNPSTYSYSTTNLTITPAPYNGADIITKTGSVATINVPADDSVTQAKLPAKTVHATAAGLGVVLKTAAFTHTGITSDTDVTGATGTLVSKGRPVKVSLEPNDNGGTSSFDILSSGGDTRISLCLVRNGTVIQKAQVGGFINVTGLTAVRSAVPPVHFTDVDAPAGTNTYKLRIENIVGPTAGISNMQMIAYET